MAAAWEKAQTLGMSLPLLIKPLPACSLPGAHDFQLVGSLAGIDRVTQDSIVQQFIPHNGTVYKIGVIGDQVSNRVALSKLVLCNKTLPSLCRLC